MKTYRVKEVFGPTLQGEGTHAGTPVLFLRFAGCNRWTGLERDRERSICGFCDTDFRGGEPLTAQQVAERLHALGGVRTVVISGGEATLQLDVALLSYLKGQGFTLHLETNGSNPLGQLRNWLDHVTMSPKQPKADTRLEYCDDLKLLYPPIDAAITADEFGDFPATARFLQPVWNEKYQVHLQATIERLYQLRGWRLSLQTHKIVGVQ